MGLLGSNSYILSDNEGKAQIGSFTSIAGGVKIHGDDNHACIDDRKLVATFPFHTWNEGFPDAESRGQTIIGNDVWIGEGACILSGVKIGNGVIVGAHAVVAKDVPAFAVVVGNPAKITRYRFTKRQIQALERIKWWEWDNQTVHNRLEDFKNIYKFIKKYD